MKFQQQRRIGPRAGLHHRGEEAAGLQPRQKPGIGKVGGRRDPFLIGQEFIGAIRPLPAQAEVAFFPPVTGG